MTQTPVIRCKRTGVRLIPRDGKMYSPAGKLMEFFGGQWRPVVNDERSGHWRFHEHYDRGGYCDNPARGY